MFELTGKVAIVTGGNGGIGLGMARGLALAGARVVVAARNEQKSAAAVVDLQARGSDALAITVDVTDERAVERLVSRTLEQCGRLDILVNNAGTTVRKPPHALGLTEWRHVIDTNLTSTFLCSKCAHSHFKRAGGGQDSGERGVARLDRHRPEPRGPATDSGPARAGARAHACRTM